MAVNKVIFAALIVPGVVKAVRNRSGEGKNGPWAVRTVTVEQPSGAQIDVVCWGNDNGQFEIGLPNVGEFFVANAYIHEAGREPEVRFLSWAFDALDYIHSSLNATESKKAA